MQGGLDQRGVGRGDDGYENVGQRDEEVECSPHVLPELSEVGGAGAGEVAEVRVTSRDHHQLGQSRARRRTGGLVFSPSSCCSCQWPGQTPWR